MEKFKTLDAFYAHQSGDTKAQVDALRQVILSAEPRLAETLKWNAPNFVFEGEDRLTMNLMNKEGKVKLILHRGAVTKEDKTALPVMTDPSGLIVWNSDIRGTITFDSSQHIHQVREQLTALVRDWLSISV